MLLAYQQHMLAAGKSPGTLRTYCNRLDDLARRHPDLLLVTADDLKAHLAERRTTHAAETRKSMRSAFKSFYGWAFEEGILAEDPAIRLPAITVPASVPRVAGDEAVQMGLLTAGDELRALIMLARYGCLRLTEFTTLHTRHREGDVLRIRGKGEKQRLVPINDELMQVLLVLERKNGTGYYFPGRGERAHLHPQSVNKMITRHLGVNPHALRHAGATAAYLATGDLEAVRLLLGHSSIATTQRYLHIGGERVRAAAEATVIQSRLTSLPATTVPASVPAAGLWSRPTEASRSGDGDVVVQLLVGEIDRLRKRIHELEDQERAA